MSLESAIRSDGNSKIPFYFQRKNKKGEWEDIGSVYSPCNNGAWGALKTARDMGETSMLGKYYRARRKGDDQARIITFSQLQYEKENTQKEE